MTKELKEDKGALRRRIGRNVERVRHLRSVSRGELCASIGWSEAKIAAIEAGMSQLTIDELALLATALGVEAALLLEATSDVVRQNDEG
jgi:transcriptional regulator with XRE-family HTH domain